VGLHWDFFSYNDVLAAKTAANTASIGGSNPKSEAFASAKPTQSTASAHNVTYWIRPVRINSRSVIFYRPFGRLGINSSVKFSSPVDSSSGSPSSGLARWMCFRRDSTASIQLTVETEGPVCCSPSFGITVTEPVLGCVIGRSRRPNESIYGI